jgi:hypothetical protein
MVETIYFIGGVILGFIITLIGFKNGAKVYNKAVTDITQPPEFQTEDRTQDLPNYDYTNYDDYYKDLEDNDKN